MCGRLRCCLVFEYEQYVEARKQLPRRNKRVGTPHGEGRVLDQLPLKDAVLVDVDDAGRKVVEREEIIPLEEFRKLAEKAHSPCDKHGDGSCDCGMPPGQRQADRVNAQAPTTAETKPSATASDDERSRRGGSRRSRGKPGDGRGRSGRRRGRRRGGRRAGRKPESGGDDTKS